MRVGAVVLAATLVLAPLGARAADLVVWWDEGYYAGGGRGGQEIVAAFEQETGKQVELVFHPAGGASGQDRGGARGRPAARLRLRLCFSNYIGQWAFEDRLVDLSDAIGHFSDLFDPDVLDWATLLNASTGQKALYGLPMGRTTNHVHVWKSLLERAGFTLADIPKEWDAFWSFWCDQVQPAVRRATGRDDIWGVGLPMSVEATTPGTSSSSSWPPTRRTT